MPVLQKITPCLWFDFQAEEAANFYLGIFKESKIIKKTHYGAEGQEIHKRPEGSVMTVEFELDGQRFIGLNGGPVFTFNEAISLTINCNIQEEIDYYWDRLSEGGDPAAQQCGWLKDKYGLSWQIVPVRMSEMLEDPDKAKAARAMKAILTMRKLDIGKLEAAYNGKE